MTDIQAMLIQQEGMELKPYVDTVGKMTIGVGRNLADKGLSREEALYLLNNDIADALEDVRHCFSCYDQLSRPRQMVLVSLAYNLGRAKLAKFVRFIGAVHLGKWGEAADELLDSKAAREDAPARYRELARMMRDNSSAWV